MSRTLRNYFNYHHFYPFPLADPWKRPSRCKLLTCKAGTVWKVRINYWLERKNQGRNWMFAFVWMFMFACVWGAGGRFVVCLNKLSSSVCLQTYFTFPLSAWNAQIEFLILLRGVKIRVKHAKTTITGQFRVIQFHTWPRGCGDRTEIQGWIIHFFCFTPTSASESSIIFDNPKLAHWHQ